MTGRAPTWKHGLLTAPLGGFVAAALPTLYLGIVDRTAPAESLLTMLWGCTLIGALLLAPVTVFALPEVAMIFPSRGPRTLGAFALTGAGAGFMSLALSLLLIGMFANHPPEQIVPYALLFGPFIALGGAVAAACTYATCYRR